MASFFGNRGGAGLITVVFHERSINLSNAARGRAIMELGGFFVFLPFRFTSPAWVSGALMQRPPFSPLVPILYVFGIRDLSWLCCLTTASQLQASRS